MNDVNPFASPQSEAQAVQPTVDMLKPIETLTKVLTFLYYGHMILPMGGFLILMLGISIDETEVSGGEMSRQTILSIGVMVLYALTSLALFLATVILHFIWTYRAAANTRVFGATGHDYSPGWAVGWFFVPVANLFVPYKVASEIVKASTPGGRAKLWQSFEVPAFVGWWWGAYVGASILSKLGNRLPLGGFPVFSLVSYFVTIFAAFFAMKYINHVCELQRNQIDDVPKMPHDDSNKRPGESLESSTL